MVNYLDIDECGYKLPKENYINKVTKKNKIVIGNTNNLNMLHYEGWLRRWGGNYTKTAMFTITLSGEIIKHFNTKYYSDFMGVKHIDKDIVSIVLENEGWLIPKKGSDNTYINYCGHIYNRKDEVFNRKWRNHEYWAPYSLEQIDSLSKLIPLICEENNIPMDCVNHLTKIENAHKEVGILYKSNFESYYTELNPSWDCYEIKNKIGIYEKR